MTRKELKSLSKEEFLKLQGMTEGVYNALQNSKEGYIRIEKIKPEPGRARWGHTITFGEGISCYLENSEEWYITSIIQKIDWDKQEFTTLNSVYKFEFSENKKDDKDKS